MPAQAELSKGFARRMGRRGVKRVFSRGGGLDLDEIEAVYRSHGAAFERVAIAIVGDDGLGCDAVSEAFVRAIRNRRSFRSESPVVAWLWRIVINEARRAGQRLRADALVSDAESIQGDVVSLNGHVDRHVIRSKIASLPERQRLALFLRYYGDLDYDAIATALDIRPGTVAATLNAARGRLALDLQEVRECSP
jgi:RNA polymerase sigma factor (sigma-70 family)